MNAACASTEPASPPDLPPDPLDVAPDEPLTPKQPSQTTSRLPDVDLAGKPILVMEFKGLVSCSDEPRNSPIHPRTFNTTDHDTSMNCDHLPSAAPEEHASLSAETPNEDELSDDAPPLDSDDSLDSKDPSRPLSRRPRKAAKMASSLDFFTKSLLKTYPRLRLDIERWEQGAGKYGKAALIKSSVDRVPWKLTLLFEQDAELLTERTKNILQGLEMVKRNVTSSDQNLGGRQFLQRLWLDLQTIGEFIDEAMSTLEDLIKRLEAYEEWQDEYIVELLEKQLITPDSPANQSMRSKTVYLNNEVVKRCLEHLGVFVRSMEEVIHGLVCFLKLFQRQNRSLELWKHFAAQNQVNLYHASGWMTYWAEVLTCSLKVFDSLSNVAKSLSRFS